MKFDPKPVTLEGTHVRLEPLAPRHAEALFEIGQDDSIWRWLTRPALASLDDARGYVRRTLELAATGNEVPFTIVHRASGAIAGATRYMDIKREDRGLEIGGTWLGLAYQRTPVNTECKYLLMRHAFETLGAARVQLKTDLRNERSQKAIERIGARREGVLRKHKLTRDDYIRDSVFFSVIDGEWPEVKRQLEAMLS
jgi:RimJ/RimL family protein N-acetyltransferase